MKSFRISKVAAACMVVSLSTGFYAQQTSVRKIPLTGALPAATTTVSVTTTGGTSGTLPYFNGTSTVLPSSLYYNSTGLGVGKLPAGALDINGKAIFRGGLNVSRAGDATAAGGFNSYPLIFQASVYNSSSKAIATPIFQLQAEPTGNNTATNGVTLNLLYGSSESGFYLNSNGTIHFSPSQTFPIASNGITSVAHDSSLTGSGTSASPLRTVALSHDSTLSGSGTSASPLTVSSSLSLAGAITARGVTGTNYTANGAAVEGNDYSNGGVGVEGLNYNEGSGYSGYGMVAEGYIGIYAYGAHYAGDFDGNVYVGGTLSKAGGSFKIDHPLDPENKYLSHSFVESPDMMNIYNGNAVTDATGTATITMPDYFEALNRDFRYQLTVMGQFAQAIVGSKISGNSFTIKTDRPNVEVSWQVTGVRQDVWANAHRIPTEEIKPDDEKGKFLHPSLFNKPAEMAITHSSYRANHIPRQEQP